MKHDLIPFESAALPAYLQAAGNINTDLTTHVGGGGFPVLSIKGKVFTLVKDKERTVITRPDDPDEAASSLEVVILRANPNLSKVWYAAGYEEGGAVAKPDCYSNDGMKPAADSASPQCKTCAACPKNIFGSGANGKGKACSDSRRIAVASAGQLNEPMLLRVPPATLKPLAEFGKALSNRGVSYAAVVTKIRFEREEATPKLTFTPVGFLSEDQFNEAQLVAKSELVENIIGIGQNGFTPDVEVPVKAAKVPVVEDAELEEAVAPAKAAIAKAAAPAKAVKAAAPEVEVEVAKPAPKAKAKATIADDFDSLLAGLGDD